MKINLSFLLISFLVFIPDSFASITTRDIYVRCGGVETSGTMRMEFDSFQWPWQCDNVVYGVESYVWVRPPPVIFDIQQGVFEVDVAKSDEYCNRGRLTSDYSGDVKCSTIAKEFMTRGMRAIYTKNWALKGRSLYSGHGFYMRNAAGDEIYLTIELDSWANTLFEARGTFHNFTTKQDCTYSQANRMP